ncbi:MAG: hypothetical protein ACE5E1_01735 [Phycisphaerae bacterium]
MSTSAELVTKVPLSIPACADVVQSSSAHMAAPIRRTIAEHRPDDLLAEGCLREIAMD